jgi:hypothetical protein
VPVIHGLAALGRQRQQLHRLAHVAGALALGDALGDLLHAVPQLRAQQLEALGLLHGVEVFALDVLDQLQLQRRVVVQVAHDHRDRVQAGHAAARRRRSPQTSSYVGSGRPSSRSRKVSSVRCRAAAHQDRLHQALRLDAGGQGVQAVDVKAAALARVVG